MVSSTATFSKVPAEANVTVPVKVCELVSRSIELPSVAVKVEFPVTDNAPVSVMSPPAVTLSRPLTVDAPSTNASAPTSVTF